MADGTSKPPLGADPAIRPLIDEEYLADLLGEDSADLAEALEAAAVEDSERAFTALRTAATAGDAPTAQSAAHALKGTGSSLGMTKFSELALIMMTSAAQGTVPDTAAVDALAQLWEESMDALRRAMRPQAA
ncbi:MAG: Hpt domain-containing protein [Pseudomonadota bacterium]